MFDLWSPSETTRTQRVRMIRSHVRITCMDTAHFLMTLTTGENWYKTLLSGLFKSLRQGCCWLVDQYQDAQTSSAAPTDSCYRWHLAMNLDHKIVRVGIPSGQELHGAGAIEGINKPAVKNDSPLAPRIWPVQCPCHDCRSITIQYISY